MEFFQTEEDIEEFFKNLTYIPEEESPEEKKMRETLKEDIPDDFTKWTPNTIASIIYQSMLTTLQVWDFGYESQLFGRPLNKGERHLCKVCFVQGVGLAITSILYAHLHVNHFKLEDVNQTIELVSKALTEVLIYYLEAKERKQPEYISRVLLKIATKISRYSYHKFLKEKK